MQQAPLELLARRLLIVLLAALLSVPVGGVVWAEGGPPPQPSPELSPQPSSRGLRAPLNGFEIAAANPNREHIRSGGPARDAIHSVDSPEFASPAEARWAPPPVGMIGVAIGDEARSYPVHLLEYHQIVNDTVGGVPVVVTFDPLTGISAVWERAVGEGVGERVLEFGVSGLLYREQFLLYDRQTQSLWAQYEGVAVAGPLLGTKLEHVASRQEPVGAWTNRHPHTTILKRPERNKIDYRNSPFEAYWVSEVVPVPVRARDARYHPKEVVLGAEVDGKRRAYLGSILTAEGGRIVDSLEGRTIRIQYDTNLGLFIYEAPEDVRVTDAYWFAWKSLHGDTEIWHDIASEPDS